MAREYTTVIALRCHYYGGLGCSPAGCICRQDWKHFESGMLYKVLYNLLYKCDAGESYNSQMVLYQERALKVA